MRLTRPPLLPPVSFHGGFSHAPSPPPSQVVLREEMEAALKESLREAERGAKRLQRTATDIEYLKNTVLKWVLVEVWEVVKVWMYASSTL